MAKFKFSNIRALADGGFLGRSEDMVLDLPDGQGTYRFIFAALKSIGWDCNGVKYDVARTDEPVSDLAAIKVRAEALEDDTSHCDSDPAQRPAFFQPMGA